MPLLIEEQLASIMPYLVKVAWYDEERGTWLLYSPSAPSNLAVLAGGEIYNIMTTAPVIIEYNGVSIPLHEGWNMDVVWAGEAPLAIQRVKSWRVAVCPRDGRRFEFEIETPDGYHDIICPYDGYVITNMAAATGRVRELPGERALYEASLVPEEPAGALPEEMEIVEAGLVPKGGWIAIGVIALLLILGASKAKKKGS